MTEFLSEDFLLKTKVEKTLYQESANSMPNMTFILTFLLKTAHRIDPSTT